MYRGTCWWLNNRNVCCCYIWHVECDVIDLVRRQFDDQRVDVRARETGQTALSSRARRRRGSRRVRRSVDVQGGKSATPTAVDDFAKAHGRRRRFVGRRGLAVHTKHVAAANTMWVERITIVTRRSCAYDRRVGYFIHVAREYRV